MLAEGLCTALCGVGVIENFQTYLKEKNFIKDFKFVYSCEREKYKVRKINRINYTYNTTKPYFFKVDIIIIVATHLLSVSVCVFSMSQQMTLKCEFVFAYVQYTILFVL